MTRALLFDLGNVILDIDMSAICRHWSQQQGCPEEAISNLFGADDNYCAHERGEITSAEYLSRTAERLGLDKLTAEQLEQGWNSIFVREVPGIRQALTQLSSDYAVAAFSNTNPSHVANMRSLYPGLEQCFNQVFYSNDIGYRKPEAEGFAHICDQLRLKPAEICFFDDLPENVDAAKQAGLQAHQVVTPDRTVPLLRELGFLREGAIKSCWLSGLEDDV